MILLFVRYDICMYTFSYLVFCHVTVLTVLSDYDVHIWLDYSGQ